MTANNFLGVVFANINDDKLYPMTEVRSTGAMPVAGRYRMVDFTLSNFVNAGITKVGVITRSNYKSLMDHLGSGRAWDLDRKNGGLYLLPPYAFSSAEKLRPGRVGAIANVIDFFKKSTEEYAVLCDADVISNLDLTEMFAKHTESGADVTFAFKHGVPDSRAEHLAFEWDSDKRATKLNISTSREAEEDYSVSLMIIGRKLLIKLVEESVADGGIDLVKDILQKKVGELDIRGFEITSYAALLDSPEAYVKINNDIINNKDIRNDLFNPERPVLTKTRDDMPTRYGLDSDVTESLIADGCRIEGTVKNSVLFRGVTIEKGARVENCIIMQDSVIGKDSALQYVTVDKDVTVGEESSINGSPNFYVYVPKGKKI